MNPLASLALLATVLVTGWMVSPSAAETPSMDGGDRCMNYAATPAQWEHC